MSLIFLSRGVGRRDIATGLTGSTSLALAGSSTLQEAPTLPPTGLFIDTSTATSATWAWDSSVQGDHLSYDFQYDDDPLFGSPVTVNSIVVEEYQATGLTEGVTYYGRVRDVTSTATSDWSAAVSVTPSGAATYNVFPFTAPSIFDNDTGIVNANAQWQVTSETPLDGTFSYQNGGGFTYVSGSSGTASFDYQILDFNGLGANTSATVSVGVVPYVPQGAIPSGWSGLINWPISPTLSSSATVNNASELSSALQNGADITLNDGDYGSFNLSTSYSDVRLTAANPGGAVFSGEVRFDGTRVRVNDIRFTGRIIMDIDPNDILFDNVHVVRSGGGASDLAAVTIGNFTRMAFINSTIRHTGDGRPILYNGSTIVPATDFILANCYVGAEGAGTENDQLRIGYTSRLIYLDNYFLADAANDRQFRNHNSVEDILLLNNIHVEGGTKLFIADNGIAEPEPGAYCRRVLIQGGSYYETFLTGNDGPFTAMTGAVDSEAIDNSHYSSAQASGSQTMNQGGIQSTFTNNIRYPYQAPPTRTQGANH